MKLFRAEVLEDCEFETVLVVANSEDEANTKVRDMDWSCLMSVLITEINEIDGHKIIVE